MIFKGHKDTILDLCILYNENIIATTSEDKTIRIWRYNNIENNSKISSSFVSSSSSSLTFPSTLSSTSTTIDTTSSIPITNALKCYTGYNTVINNILFYIRDSSSNNNNNNHNNNHNNNNNNSSYSKSIIGISDNSILQFDLNLNNIINFEFNYLYKDSLVDICCFTIHPRDSILAFGDENGTINILNIQNGKILKRLSRIHSNLLGKILYNPINPSILISGGFDSLCCAWDVGRGRPISNVINFQEINNNNPENSNNLQIANPPFVHDLLHIFNGRVIICALGDGTLQLFKSSDCSLTSVSNIIEAHSGMVTNLSHLPINNNNERIDYFISVSTSGTIKIWSVSEVMETTESNDNKPNLNSNSKSKKNKKKERRIERYEVTLIDVIQHSNKINSVTGFFDHNNSNNNNNNLEDDCKIFVCDVTSDWYMYSLNINILNRNEVDR